MLPAFIAILLLVAVSVYRACACLRRSLAGETARRTGALMLASGAVWMLVFGSRLTLAHGRVSWAPYLDQWYAEVSGLLVPLVHGHLGWRDLFSGNNEHRVILTRCASLVEVLVNGSWDNQVRVTSVFALQATAVAWVSLLAWQSLGFPRGSVVAAAAVLPMGLVCDWENMVSGFQDQFGFMILGSLVAFSLLGDWGALLIALLMLGSMASGLLTAAALAAVTLLTAAGDRTRLRAAIAFSLGCGAVVALGWFTRERFPPVPGLYADGWATWFAAFLAYASWPLPPTPLGAACLWLPCLLLAAATLGGRNGTRFGRFCLALGTWVVLQACALAWSRASLRGLVSARYTEVLSWGFVANVGALLVLVSEGGAPAWKKRLLYAGIVPWSVWIGASEAWRSEHVYRPYLEVFRQQTIEHERRLGSFMRSNDPHIIDSVTFPHIPGTASELIALLRDKELQERLPGPLRRDGVRDRDPSRLAGIRDGPLSQLVKGLFRCRFWVLGAAAAAALASVIAARRSAGMDGSSAAAPPTP